VNNWTVFKVPERESGRFGKEIPMAHDNLRRQITLSELDESLLEKEHLEQVARAGGATQARMIGLERRIAIVKAALRSYETEH
jgi:formiminotetrahydrofolate cyclodeaminase